MSVEQVARDFVTNMNNAEKLKAHISVGAVASGGVLPQPIPMLEALNIIGGLMAGIPDMKYDIQKVTVNGNQATVNVKWGGTQTGPLSMPGMATVPATGKKVSVKDTYIITVQGDKISHFNVDSPADGGIPGALAQLGVKMPAI